MIDERAVQSAKFWEELRSVRVQSGLRESEFELFALMMLGLTCVADSLGPWPVNVTHRAQKTFEFLRTAARYRDEDKLRQAWFDTCDVLATISGTSGQADVPREVGSCQRRLKTDPHSSESSE